MAAEWRRRGYRVLALNTAQSDLRGLTGRQAGVEIPAQDLIDIGVDGADGAGRDPAFGARAVRVHGQTIVDAVRSRLAGADAFVLMAGLGGGTGSAVAELIDVLLPLEVPILVVCTLPSDGESGIAKVNAARAIDAIVKAQLRKVLLSSGTLLVHAERLKDGVLAAADLMDVVDKAIDGGDFLARGNAIDAVAYAAVLVSGPERALKSTPMQVFEELAVELKKKTAGGAVFDGLSISADDQPLRCTVLLSTLSVPKRVHSLVERATAEGAALAKKIARDMAPLDTAALDGLSLFRGTRGAGSLPPMPASSSSSSSTSTSTSLPPMPARSAPAPVRSAPVAQPSSLILPQTTAREAVKRPLVVTEVLPGGSNLPSLPDNLMLPPPNVVVEERPVRAVSDEMTMEGDTPQAVSPGIESLGPAGGLQGEMEESVLRYRGGDKKVKERIGRKWLEDSRSTDVQVRLLAVLAMVQVGDGAFRRALTRCSNDDNDEIAALAIKGLDALGDVPGVE